MIWNQYVYLEIIESFIRKDINFNQFRNQFERLLLKNLTPFKVYHVQVLPKTYVEFTKLIVDIYDCIEMEAEIDSLNWDSLNDEFLRVYLKDNYLLKIHQYCDDKIIVSDELINMVKNNIWINLPMGYTFR